MTSHVQAKEKLPLAGGSVRDDTGVAKRARRMHQTDPQKAAHVQRIRDACLLHAGDLLAGARLLKQSDMPHLALNYAVIAIEEVGKGVLIRLGEEVTEKGEGTWPARAMDDHVRKLFFALWGPTFGREVLTKEQIETHTGFARRLHEKRLRALYVSTLEDLAYPRDTVPVDEVQGIIELATARLNLERAIEFRELSSQEQQRMNWFLARTRDDDTRAMILSGSSMAKLAELGDCNAWIAWLKEQFDVAEAQALSAAHAEINRRRPSDLDNAKDKWRLTFRLHSFSHGIRPQALSRWNEKVSWIKLFRAGSTKTELIVKMTLQNAILIHDLWWVGMGLANRFLIALNVGTMGYFWWLQPRQVDRYYEQLIDLEREQEVQVQRSPALRLNWGHHKLDESTLSRVSTCFAGMPLPSEADRHVPFNEYLAGLAWLGKTDIHMQFEVEAFSSFWRSLREGIRTYGEWDGTGPYSAAYERVANQLYPGIADRLKYHELGALAEEGRLDRKSVTLSEVGAMKLLADGFLVRMLRREVELKRDAERE